MTGDAETVLTRHVAAFNARDLDALLAGFTDDARWTTGRDAVRGRDELRALFSAAMTGLLPTLTIRSLVAGRDRVAAELTETMMVDGRRRVDAIAGFYELRSGRIASATIYREGSAEVASTSVAERSSTCDDEPSFEH